jgi:hypothetical protein
VAIDERSLDEIVLDAFIASGQHPHPQDVIGAVHYAMGTYPYPYNFYNEDEWMLRTNLHIAKTFPPDKYDHPFAGDLYIISDLSPSEVEARCHPGSLACTIPHDTWCLIIHQRESDLIARGWTINLTMRHELGHCNGWDRDHTGARSLTTNNK